MSMIDRIMTMARCKAAERHDNDITSSPSNDCKETKMLGSGRVRFPEDVWFEVSRSCTTVRRVEVG